MRTKNQITVCGRVSLLKAFVEELNAIGYTEYRGPGDEKIYLATYADGRYCFRNHDCGNTIYHLPNDWHRALELASETLEEEFKVGDWVMCKEDHSRSFTKGKLYKVREPMTGLYSLGIEEDDKGSKDNGWAHKFFRKTTPEEIEKHLMDQVRAKYKEGQKVAGKRSYSKGAINSLTKEVRPVGGTIRLAHYIDSFDQLWIDGGVNNICIYEKGEWSEIISSTPQIEKCGYKGEFTETGLNFNNCARFDKQLFIDLSKIFKYKYSNSNREIISIKTGKADFTKEEVIEIAKHFEGGNP
jgi:hypothetical protein